MGSVAAPPPPEAHSRRDVVPLECRCPAHPRRQLDLEQPFKGDPDHLIGRCGRCADWYLVSYDPWAGEYTVTGAVSLAAPGARVA